MRMRTQGESPPPNPLNVGACTLNESSKTYRRIMADKRLWMGELRAGRQADPFAMRFVVSFPRRNGVRILPDKQAYAISAHHTYATGRKVGRKSARSTVVVSRLLRLNTLCSKVAYS